MTCEKLIANAAILFLQLVMQELTSYERQEQIKNIFNPLTAPVKRCQRCGSVFINDFECEACGYQFNRQWVGEPLGTNSLYSLQQQFYERQSWWQKKLNIGNKALKQAYQRQLLKRFAVLFFYLENRNLQGQEQNRLSLFLLELKDICSEMVEQQIAFFKIKRLVEKSTDDFLRQSVFQWFNSELRTKHFSWLDFILHYRLGGVIRLSFLLLFVTLMVILSSLALAFLPLV